jgi:hypothetical protein
VRKVHRDRAHTRLIGAAAKTPACPVENAATISPGLAPACGAKPLNYWIFPVKFADNLPFFQQRVVNR